MLVALQGILVCLDGFRIVTQDLLIMCGQRLGIRSSRPPPSQLLLLANGHLQHSGGLFRLDLVIQLERLVVNVYRIQRLFQVFCADSCGGFESAAALLDCERGDFRVVDGGQFYAVGVCGGAVHFDGFFVLLAAAAEEGEAA